jgi:hypothetical protein
VQVQPATAAIRIAPGNDRVDIGPRLRSPQARTERLMPDAGTHQVVLPRT